MQRMLLTVAMRQKIPYVQDLPVPELMARVAARADAFSVRRSAVAGNRWRRRATDTPTAKASQPITITLDDAIHRAQANDPGYAVASADSRVSALDRSIAKASMLPNVTYHNQYLYTEPNGLTNQAGQGVAGQQAPKFIANNAVREYASQAVVNETLGLGHVAGVRHADATAAQAAAELEVARRGLVSAVTGLFYGLAAADNKLAAVQRALTEAEDFTKLTNEREQAREAAHADVLKARLEQQQRERDLSDARLQAEKSRLELAVLLFPDPHTVYTVSVRSGGFGRAQRCRTGRGEEQSGVEERICCAQCKQCRRTCGARGLSA